MFSVQMIQTANLNVVIRVDQVQLNDIYISICTYVLYMYRYDKKWLTGLPHRE